MQTPLKLDIWVQSYEDFVNAKNNIKQKNLNIRIIPLDHVTLVANTHFIHHGI